MELGILLLGHRVSRLVYHIRKLKNHNSNENFISDYVFVDDSLLQ